MEIIASEELKTIPIRSNVLEGTDVLGFKLHGKFDVESAQADLWVAEKDGQIAIAKFYRFKNSSKIQTALPHHKHITPILASGDVGGTYVEVTPFRKAGSLASEENKALFLDNVANCKVLLEQSVNALSFLHENGIQHRDLKPDNMLLRSKEPIEIELTDFGSASFATQTMLTMARGTPAYIAPEAATGLYSNASDFWSIGAILFELYLGRPLYKEVNGHFTAVAANFEIPEDIDTEMFTLFHGLLEKNWEKRWGTKEIKDWLAGKTPTKIIQKQTTQEPKLRGPDMVTLLGIVTIVGVLIGIAVPALRDAKIQAEEAKVNATEANIETAKQRYVVSGGTLPDDHSEILRSGETSETWQTLAPYLVRNGITLNPAVPPAEALNLPDNSSLVIGSLETPVQIQKTQ